MEIREEQLAMHVPAKVEALLREHLDDMYSITPPESVHALDLSQLQTSEVTFWSVWDADELLGCGALKELDAEHGEIKSMRTRTTARRRGVGARVVEHILDCARTRGYRRLSLETGAQPEFAPARALYERYGFEPCAPFADYVEDPNSVFMTLAL